MNECCSLQQHLPHYFRFTGKTRQLTGSPFVVSDQQQTTLMKGCFQGHACESVIVQSHNIMLSGVCPWASYSLRHTMPACSRLRRTTDPGPPLGSCLRTELLCPEQRQGARPLTSSPSPSHAPMMVENGGCRDSGHRTSWGSSVSSALQCLWKGPRL